MHAEDRAHIDFLAGAQLVIHDAQYTLEEYPGKKTWGHCPAERAVDYAVAARAERLALYHHDPARTDAAMDEIVARCRARAQAAGSALDVFGAAEGLSIDFGAIRARAGASEPSAAGLPARSAPRPDTATLLVVDDDADVVDLLVDTFEAEGFRVLTAGDGETALAVARTEHPDLVVLDWNLPGRSGIEVCRALRAASDPVLREVPVVMLTGQAQAEHTTAGFDAGVTDYVTKPFKPTYVRARVHTWLSRRRGAGAP